MDPLSGQVLNHDCISVIVSRFTIWAVSLVFQHSSQFGSFGKCVITLCTPDLTPRVLAAPLEVHETKSKCLHFSASGSPEALLRTFINQILPEFLHPISQFTRNIFLYILRFLLFILVFGFCSGSPKLFIRSSTSFLSWRFHTSFV